MGFGFWGLGVRFRVYRVCFVFRFVVLFRLGGGGGLGGFLKFWELWALEFSMWG